MEAQQLGKCEGRKASVQTEGRVSYQLVLRVPTKLRSENPGEGTVARDSSPALELWDYWALTQGAALMALKTIV